MQRQPESVVLPHDPVGEHIAAHLGAPAMFFHETDGGAILLPPVSAPEPFHSVTVEGKDIYFHCVVPLFKEELDLARHRGFAVLIDKFNDKDVTDVVDPARKNSVKKKFLGLF